MSGHKIFALLIRKGMKFIPAGVHDVEALKAVQDNEMVICSIDDTRNVRFHRKFFALLNLVFHHLPEDIAERLSTVDLLLHEIKLRLGLYVIYITPKGNRSYKTDSIAFDKMSQSKFTEFYDNALKVIFKYYLTGWDEVMIDQILTDF